MKKKAKKIPIQNPSGKAAIESMFNEKHRLRARIEPRVDVIQELLGVEKPKQISRQQRVWTSALYAAIGSEKCKTMAEAIAMADGARHAFRVRFVY